MLFLIGIVVVFGSVAGGYAMHHGQFGVLWQPNEIVIIFGAAVGAFIISANGDLLKDTCKGLKKLFIGKPYKKKHYLELLTFMFEVFKLMKSKGMLAIEAHLENPHESELFKKYPTVIHDHHVLDFFCDYLRMLTMGIDNQYQLEDAMDREIDLHHQALHEVSAGVGSIGEGMPALGIVAAVLGVITTMKSISEPPEILGGLIAAALVGTFLGVLLSYGVLSPISNFLNRFAAAETQYYICIKTGLISHIQGNAAAVSVEFARKVIPAHERPNFAELEAAMNGDDKGAS